MPSYFFIVWCTRTRLDESLDVLAAHGLGGVTGMIFNGLLAQKSWNGVENGLFFGNPAQLGVQLLAILATVGFSFVGTFVLLRLVGLVMPLRASKREEGLGMDVTQHGEEAYTSGEGAILVKADASSAVVKTSAVGGD